MKKFLMVLVLFLLAPLPAKSQGVFHLDTHTAPTRIGLTNGPLAGRGIWGQALAGFTAESLTPVGFPTEHWTNGWVVGETISVSFASRTNVLVRMAAWDGRIWGTSFAGVPVNQLGFTDIVPIFLYERLDLPDFTLFTSPAVVPLVPEPSAIALAILGGVALLVHFRRRCRPRQPASERS